MSFVEYKKSEDFTKRVHEGRKVVVRRSATIILVEVVTHLQFPSGRRWKKTFPHKVPYQGLLIGPSE
jgi:predicted Holliday junction resolvase-like endonuclease